MASHDANWEEEADLGLTFKRVLQLEDAVEDSGESRRAGEDYDAAVNAKLLQPKPAEISSSLVLTPRVSRGGKMPRKKKEGVSVIWCDSSTTICGGKIGRQSLFCIRDTQNCSVLAHRTNKIFNTEDAQTHGLYVLGGSSTQNDQASSDLFLQADLASADQVRRYPTTSMAKEEWGGNIRSLHFKYDTSVMLGGRGRSRQANFGFILEDS